MNIKNINAGIFFLVVLLGFSSCKDSMINELTSIETDRAFSPTGLTATVVNKTDVRLVWKAVSNAESYTIEIFDKANVDFSGTPIKTVNGILFKDVPYTVTGFPFGTAYSVRVKAIGKVAADSKYITAAFTTETEQIFKELDAEKLKTNSVTLNWTPNENVTSITIMPGDIIHTITDLEKTAGEVLIAGLTPKTAYTATLLLNTTVRGIRLFTTHAELPTGEGVVNVAAKDDLADLIAKATTNTKFVVLQGTIYNSDVELVLPTGIDISIIGEIGATKPIISFLKITLPKSGGKLHFENVELTGYKEGKETESKREYIINQGAETTMDEVSFENCTIHHFKNSPMRIQSANAITIDKFIVNKCMVDDIGVTGTNGNYAFINSNVVGKINNITITNSSFSSLGYGLILHNKSSPSSVIVENNTFYNMGGDGRYLIDFDSFAIANGFSFKNNIVGKTFSVATAKGIRSVTVPTVENNYKTSDAVFASDFIPSIINYTDASSVLFTAPASQNFKIKDDTFVGKKTAGDPQWRL